MEIHDQEIAEARYLANFMPLFQCPSHVKDDVSFKNVPAVGNNAIQVATFVRTVL